MLAHLPPAPPPNTAARIVAKDIWKDTYGAMRVNWKGRVYHFRVHCWISTQAAFPDAPRWNFACREVVYIKGVDTSKWPHFWRVSVWKWGRYHGNWVVLNGNSDPVYSDGSDYQGMNP